MSKLHFGLGVIVGCIVGGGAVYIATKDSNDRYLTEETEHLRKYYKDKYEKDVKSLEELQNDREKKEMEEGLKAYEDLIKETDYTAFSTYSILEDEPDEEWINTPEDIPFVDSEPEEKDDGVPVSEHPYLIDHDQYENTCRNYFKEDYTYYPDDGTLADRRDKPVDIESIYNEEVERLLNDPKTSQIYVRNDKLQMDFSIIIDRTDFL